MNIRSVFQKYTLLERVVEGGREGPVSGQKPSHKSMQSVTTLSKFQMRQAGTEEDIREAQSVSCATPDVPAGDRLSQRKEKSAQKCVSIDRARSQLLSSDRTVTAGMPRGLSIILLELKAHTSPS